MRTALFVLVMFASVKVLPSPPSPFITVCDAPACSKTAIFVEPPHQEQRGLDIIASPAVVVSVPTEVSKIAAQGNILAVFFEDGQRIGATTLTRSDLGIASHHVSMRKLFQQAFLKPYPALPSTSLDAAILHAVRSLKLSAFGGAPPRYFQREKLTVFYYPAKDTGQYKIYIADEAHDGAVAMIDLYGFTNNQAEQFLASIRQQH